MSPPLVGGELAGDHAHAARVHPHPPSSDLDLSASSPATAPAASPNGLDLLDLSPAVPAPAQVRPPARPGPSARRPVSRVGPRGRVILTPQEPTVTLNRVQSGVGTLTFEAVCSPAVGDLTLGALFQLSDGSSSLVQRSRGLRQAPASSRRPVLTTARAEFDQMVVDLRQTRTLERLLVFAVSESGSELQWGGTLVTRTYGGARIELPLDFGAHHGPIALMSLYNIDGEYVLRAESDPIDGGVRDVARAFGYDRITWADNQMPVV